MAPTPSVTAWLRCSSEAAFPAQLEDALAAIHWLQTNADALGVDPYRIGVWGISAGGHLAAFLGVQSEVQAVVDVCGPVDFLDPTYRLELEDANGVISRLVCGPWMTLNVPSGPARCTRFPAHPRQH